MGDVALICNPRSHAVATRGSILATVAARRPSSVYVELDDFNSLNDQVAGLARTGVRSIIIEGGDGTLEAILSACLADRNAFQQLPRFGLLPGGSTNLAYKVMGLHRASADYVLDRLDRADGARRGDAVRHRALVVDADSLVHPVAGFLLSTGSLARAMLFTQKQVHGDGRRGVVSVARAASRLALWPHSTLAEDGAPVIRPSHFVALDDAAEPTPAPQAFSLLTTLPSLSLRLKPFWNRGAHPISYSRADWPIRKLRQGVGRLLLGAGEKEMTAHGMHSHGVDSMTFQCEGPVILDGECLPQPADDIFRVSASPELDFLR